MPYLLLDINKQVVIEANKHAAALFKKADGSLKGTQLAAYTAAWDQQRLQGCLEKNTAGTEWTETLHLQTGEEIVVAEVTGWVFPFANELVYHLLLIDRTSVYTQQEQMAVLAQRYMDFIEQSAEGIYLHEFDPPISIHLSDAAFVEELKEKSYVTECNDALARMYGFGKAEDMRGLRASTFVDFHDPLNIEYLKMFKRNGLRIVDTESKEFDRFGKPRYFLNSLVSVVENGLLKRVWGTQRDITERREIEKKVRLLTNLVEHTADVLIAIDKNFCPLTWNNAAERIFGLSAQQVIGKNLYWFIDINYHQASREEVIVTIHAKGEWRGEISFRRPTDLKVKTMFAGFKALHDEGGELIGYIISATDITQRIEVDNKIRLLANLVKNTSDVLIAVDLNFITISWNDAATCLSGIAAEQIIGKDVRDFLDLYHQKHNDESVLEKLSECGEWRGEVHFTRPADGKKLALISTYKLLKDDLGTPIGYIVSCIDITERKEAEWRLKESEQRFRRLVHNLQVGVLLQDCQGRIIMANQIVLDQLMVTEDDVKGAFIYDIVTIVTTECGKPITINDRPIVQVLKTRQPLRGLVIGVHLPKSGAMRWLMLDIQPIFNEEGVLIHIITSLIDITERKNLETRLRLEEVRRQQLITKATIDGQEKERREIGKELHDNIGQQLTTVKLYLELTLATAKSPADEIITPALKCVAGLIDEVRSMSRSLLPPTLGDLGLVEAVTELIETVSRAQAIQIHLVKTEFEEAIVPDNMRLTFFRIIQEQLNNIMKHAQATTAWIYLASNKDSIVLEVSDNGIGFDLTKVRKGAGLGNIRSRVELFYGSMEIVSNEGEGCMIKVAIPVKSDE